MDLSSEKAVREFLRLCLAPRPGMERTPAKLAEILPGPLVEALERFAPHLAAYRKSVARYEKQLSAARDQYAVVLGQWINAEPADAPKFPGLPRRGACPVCERGYKLTHAGLLPRHIAHIPEHRDTGGLYCQGVGKPPATQDAPEASQDLCTQNGQGDAATPRPHVFAAPAGGPVRCLFCAVPTDGVEAGYRTPDGREWTLAAEHSEDGLPLYESPFVGTRYTAEALASLHGATEPLTTVQAPPYVHNARSVNRRPGTAVKHIPDGHGSTICPRAFQASKPMPPEEAARLPLCGGCRDAALDAAGTPATATA